MYVGGGGPIAPPPPRNFRHWLLLSFIDPPLGGFGEILPEYTSGNISQNPPSGGSINDILYRKNDINYAENVKFPS